MQKITDYYDYFQCIALRYTRNQDDANDLLHDTMLRAMENIHQFTPGTNLKAWLFTIMKSIFANNYKRNTFINSVVSKGYDANYEYDEFDKRSRNIVADSQTAGAEDTMHFKQIIGCVEKLKHSEIMLLYASGYQYNEIAKICNLSIGTVKSRIFYSRQTLKQSFPELIFTL